MPSSQHSFYEGKITFCSGQIRTVQKRLSLIAWLRLIVFAGLALVTYQLIKTGFPYAVLCVALLLLLIFSGLVGLALKYKDRRSLLEKLLYVNSNELGVLKNELNGFEDGKTFLTQESYLDDLDIFGIRSLFHLLNRTTTSHGRDKLAGLLKQPLLSPEEIKKYQEAVRVLARQADERQSLIAQGLLNQEKEGNLHSLGDWLESPARLIRKKRMLISRWILVIYNTGGLLAWAITGNYTPLLIGILAGWIITALFSGYIAEQHAQLSKKHGILEQYLSILQFFRTMDAGESAILRTMKAETGLACLAIRDLAKLSTFFDQSLNFLIGFFLNNLFLYNLNCVIALEKWKEAHKKSFPAWIDLVGHIECLNSLAAFAFNNPAYIYPSPSPEGSLFIETTGMTHPLIATSERVTNDFKIAPPERLILVTGSNMSGKTTFLRTAGVNLLLAQCGAPVCAASFSFTPMQILSSLRVSDSLQEHTSYFMAELKKLRQIIDHLQNGQPALVLVDEILRGTNSEDKTHGSEQFIHKLLQYNCLSLFATHDLSLSTLETESHGTVCNYCFESVIENGELHFNYQLQRGVARNRNASFLMEKMGII